MDGRRLILNVKGAVYFLTAPFEMLIHFGMEYAKMLFEYVQQEMQKISY